MDANENANASQNKEDSKKFIRTFSSDIDILKKGGTPDLTPFVTVKETNVQAPSVPTNTGAVSVGARSGFPVFRDLPESVKAAFDEHAKEAGATNVPEGNPEEYVRTFSGDMRTLKKGGVPDLTLFKKASVVKENVVVTDKKDVSFTEHDPIGTPLGTAPSPAERLVASSPLEQGPVISPEKEEVIVIPPVPAAPAAPIAVKTYASDFSEKVKETRASPVTILAAEQDAATGAPEIVPPQKSVAPSSLAYIAAGVILIVLSGVGGYIAYTKYAADFHPILFQFAASSPIFVDDKEQVSGTGSKLFESITASVGRPLASGTVRLLYTASSTDNVESVFSSLHAPAPDILRRNVRTAGSMAGVVNVGGVQSPFFILSVDSYAETFSGMLAWEPSIQEQLQMLFPLAASTTAPGAASATQAATSTRLTKTVARPTLAPTVQNKFTNFVDEVVANHDVRVYRDADGAGVMVYGYWDETTLVIAKDTAAFTEILQRLATSRAR